MHPDFFEISILKDTKKETFDKHNASKEALHAFKVFAQSLDEIISSEFANENVECDLGTDKLAIKSSEGNIKLLNKWIQDYKEHKLAKKHKAYKALEAIEKVFTENGLTYKAIVRSKNEANDVTPVFKKEKGITKPVYQLSTSNRELELGLHFLNGKIINVQAKRSPFYIIIEIGNNVEHRVYLTSESFYKLNHFIDSKSVIHIVCHTIRGEKNRVQNWFFEQLLDAEFETFEAFYNKIPLLEGTEKLKFIYRFFNSLLIEEKFHLAVKFARFFLLDKLEINDFNVQRMILDVFKKVSDEEQIKDIYNEFVSVVTKKLGKSIY